MLYKYIIQLIIFFPFFVQSNNEFTPCYESKSTSFTKYLTWTDEKAQVAKFISKLIGNSNTQRSLLDIGADNGELTQKIAPLFNKIVAIEPSYKLFKQLNEECNDTKYTCINKPFEQIEIIEKFDVILLSFSLQYITNYTKELTRIKKLLKPNGVILITEVDPKNNELYTFYRKHIATVLGHEIAEPECIYLDNILTTHFTVTKDSIFTTLAIPNVINLLEIANFIFDTDWEFFHKNALKTLQNNLIAEYEADKPVIFTSPVTIFICTKK